MALIIYTQTDTAATFNVGCSGQGAGVATGANQATPGGTAGSTPVTVDPDNLSTNACFAFDCVSAPGVASWAAGDYVVRINHSTIDAGTQLTRVDVCDFDGTSTYASVASNTAPGHTRGAAGVIAVTVNRATSYTPQSQANSRVFIVLTYNNNDNHGTSTVDITPNQNIDTPIDDGVSDIPTINMAPLRGF